MALLLRLLETEACRSHFLQQSWWPCCMLRCREVRGGSNARRRRGHQALPRPEQLQGPGRHQHPQRQEGSVLRRRQVELRRAEVLRCCAAGPGTRAAIAAPALRHGGRATQHLAFRHATLWSGVTLSDHIEPCFELSSTTVRVASCQADDKMRASCGWDGTDFKSLGDECGIMQCGGKVVRNARSDGHTIHGARCPR